jgi:outer membrane biosynthesis protein TonB
VRRSARNQLAGPFSISVLLHLGVAALLLVAGRNSPVPQALSYTMRLNPAPAGQRQPGVVRNDPPAVETKAGSETASVLTEVPKSVPVPPKAATRKPPAPVRSTATNSAKSARAAAPDSAKVASSKAVADQRAGAGPKGGAGSDVAKTFFDGLEFEDPAYLRGIVNRIASSFPDLESFSNVAIISFDIQRDGCIRNLRITRRSPNAIFNSSAMGAIERAGKNCGFGALPAVWKDDVLPIHFTFDPRLIR